MTTHPVDYWISQVLQLLSIFDALLMLILYIILYLLSKIFTSDYAFSTDLQALVNLEHRQTCVVKTVHAASRTLIIHDVELFIEEGEEAELS